MHHPKKGGTRPLLLIIIQNNEVPFVASIVPELVLCSK